MISVLCYHSLASWNIVVIIKKGVGKSFRYQLDTRVSFSKRCHWLLYFCKTGLSAPALELPNFLHFPLLTVGLLLLTDTSIVPIFGFFFFFFGVCLLHCLSPQLTICIAWPGSIVSCSFNWMKSSSIFSAEEVVSCCWGLPTFSIYTKNCSRFLYFFHLW